MRRTCPTLLLTAALVMAACQKDNPMQQWVEVSTESYNTAKVALDGTNATWADGDELLVNGTTTAIHHINGHTYIDASAVNATGVNRALYPADLSTSDIGTDNISVNLPAQYRYRTDNSGHQLLAIPMAARSDGASPMLFHHLTGALVFNIVNHLDRPLTLDRLTVQSDRYSLSGTRNIDFSALDATSDTTPVQADRTVELIFDGQQLAAGDSLSVTVPIAPVGADNHFTISVSGHHEGTRYSYSRSQTSGGALARNQMGYARTEMNTTDNRTQTGALFRYSIRDVENYIVQYYISTPEEFKLMAEAISNKWFFNTNQYPYNKGCYKIENDIDMSGLAISPITGFAGKEFDGGSHTISNLTINGADGNCGLFDTIRKANIHDITLNNTTLNYTGTGELHIAPLICDLTSSNTLTNCNINNVNVEISNSVTNICYGGLIAYCKPASGDFTIQSCTTNHAPSLSTANGWIYCGGLIGHAAALNNTLFIASCHVECTDSVISSTKIYYGGFIGNSLSTIITTNCTWSGENVFLNCSGLYLGGIVGRITADGLSSNACAINGTISTDNPSTKYTGKYAGYKTAPGFTLSTSSSEIKISVDGDTVSANIGN